MINIDFFCNMLQHTGLTLKQLAKKAGVPEDTVKNIRYGRVDDIKSSTIVKICDALGCTTDELLGRSIVNQTEINMVRAFRQLSTGSQQFILSILRFESALTRDYSDVNAIKHEILIFRPTGNMEDGMIYDSTSYVELDVGKYAELYGEDSINCGFLITNDSMQPVYQPDDVILVCTRPPRSGDIAVLIHRASGRLYLRKYYPGTPTLLEPITNYGRATVWDTMNPVTSHDWTVFGYVVTKTRYSALKKPEDKKAFPL